MLAAILLVIAGYCATRLAMARRWQRSTDHGADIMHIVMGVAMAGMLLPRLNPLQARAWAALFAAGAAWFAGRAVRARWRARATASPRSPVSRGRHGAHVLSCSAMVCMLLAGPAAGARVGAGPGTGLLPVAALFLAIAVSVSVVVSTDRLAALRPVPVPVTTAPAPAGPALAEAAPAPSAVGQVAGARPAPSAMSQVAGAWPVPGCTGQAAAAAPTPAPAGPRPVLSPRLAACCQIMMGVAMAYMLIAML